MRAHQRHAKATECFAFTWRRRIKGPGFRWQRDPAGRTLLVGPPQESLQSYEPLVEETGLFLTFAHLAATPDAFLCFANRYGRLGTYKSFGPEYGEPLDEWRLHQRWMRFLANLRSACLGKGPGLGRYVKWEGAFLRACPGAHLRKTAPG